MKVTLLCRKNGNLYEYDEVTGIEETKDGVVFLKDDHGVNLRIYLGSDFFTIIGEGFNCTKITKEVIR